MSRCNCTGGDSGDGIGLLGDIISSWGVLTLTDLLVLFLKFQRHMVALLSI